MSDTTASLRRKISSAGDLQSVVRTMKALAASSIGQYEKSVRALGDYYRTVELGLGACFRENEPATLIVERKGQTDAAAIGAVVFGSDQGLVGQFNDVVADYAVKTLAALPGKPHVWAVGERVHARLTDDLTHRLHASYSVIEEIVEGFVKGLSTGFRTSAHRSSACVPSRKRNHKHTVKGEVIDLWC